MAILIDTNILLRVVQPTHPMHPVAVRALEILMSRGERLMIAVQSVAEFWNVATRPEANNGLGFTIEESRDEVKKLEGFFEILYENARSYGIWKELVLNQRVRGTKVHDTRLGAVMMANEIRQIVTFNVADFARFTSIVASHPDQIT